ncbi:MAG: SOS response-associated peptidase [Gammaproteobacteria bacterium]|nr:SOS response-associated peptidase [Gammaproteobacteria bacterium]
MCGRFTQFSDVDALTGQFGLAQPPHDLSPHYNIAPTQQIAIVREIAGLGRHLDYAHWGLIPSWSKDAKIGNRLFNARAETVAEKPAFRNAYRHKRCLIPTDGFYEWAVSDRGKQPWWIAMADQSPFAFAGLWEHWESPEDGRLVESCTIITTESNRQIKPLHERMPLIISPDHYAVWLDPAIDQPQQLNSMLAPYIGELHLHPVSRDVNSPLKDNHHLIEAVELDG